MQPSSLHLARYTRGVLDLRFPTALQAMLSLALAAERGVPRLSSAGLGGGLRANPSLVRRLLRQLSSHGLVTSTLGKAGGVSLARQPGTITLAEIYVAATEGKPLWTARADIPHRCVVSSNIEPYFTDLAAQAEAAVRETLADKTLANVLTELRARDRRASRRVARVAPSRRA
jgi:Rrf2 family transcriptional regulator, repressor of oqxAB